MIIDKAVLTPQYIDLRSDTATWPSYEMRCRMMAAPVGDDALSEDPTVRQLQITAAKITGKESALFVPSGTMANQIAMHVFCKRNDMVVTSRKAHIVTNESDSAKILNGVNLYELGNSKVFTKEELEKYLELMELDDRCVSLVSLENTHTFLGGSIVELSEMNSLCELARNRSIKSHLDGSRIFNAAIALKTPVHTLVEKFDSVTFCLSKGLGAPVGSMLCGTHEFIEKARATRKILGGTMRQAGILASAGLYALDNNVDRLAEDHVHATYIAQSLKDSGIKIINDMPETNIVLFEVPNSPEHFSDQMNSRGILVRRLFGNRFRIVTHLNITRNDVDKVVDCIKEFTR